MTFSIWYKSQRIQRNEFCHKELPKMVTLKGLPQMVTVEIYQKSKVVTVETDWTKLNEVTHKGLPKMVTLKGLPQMVTVESYQKW